MSRFIGAPYIAATTALIMSDSDSSSVPGSRNLSSLSPNIMSDSPRSSVESVDMSAYMKFLALVGHDQASTDSDPWKTTDSQLIERFSNTPIFTAAVARFVGALANSANVSAPPVPQYGLIGIHETIRDDSLTPVERLVMTNTTIPWSTFICGSQGSGKSHTFSCLLENALVQSDFIGALPHPLTGLVMHYDKYTSHSTTQVCEAAYLCSAGIPVNVLVSPSNIWTMKRLYANLPGLPADAPRPKVLPLYLDEHHLSIGRILKLMAVDTSEKTVPLYMEVITSILREMAMEGTAFTYTEKGGANVAPFGECYSAPRNVLVPSEDRAFTQGRWRNGH
jgi:hypothetical protein